MESTDAVPRFELDDILAHFVNYARDVIALVDGDIKPFLVFPSLPLS